MCYFFYGVCSFCISVVSATSCIFEGTLTVRGETVSYTHLDVYKRQVYVTAQINGVTATLMIDTGANVSLMDSTEPVSYTHLDVYKRQLLNKE